LQNLKDRANMNPIKVCRKTIRSTSRALTTLVSAWLAATFLLGLSVPADLASQETELVDRIVAVVNNKVVTLYDLNRAMAPYVKNIKALQYAPDKERQTIFQVRQDLLNQLIDGMLADQLAERDKITVSQQEINKTIERFKESRHLTDEQLREGLESQGITMEEYRNEIQEQILRTKLVNREVKAKIVITREDIKKYYDDHREKYTGEQKYYLWNIYIKVASGSSRAERSAARSRMNAIMARLKQGDSFVPLVNELNNSFSPVQGTDLGLYRLEEVSEQLRRAVEKLRAGEFSGVLDTNFGYQILYVEKIETSQAKALEEVESEIEELLYKEMVDHKYQEWLEGLRARSHIRIIN